jgi:predicted metal-binding membrane protein
VPSQRTTALESIVQRDRLVLFSGLIGISAIAWAYTIMLSGGAGHGAQGAHATLLAQPRSWTATDLATTFGMWTVMMLAMMLPTAAPMVLSLAKISRGQSVSTSPVAPATGFLLGYAIVLTGFSGVAALAQWGFHQVAWTTMTGESTNRVFAGAVLLGAGAFQFSRLKEACLHRCRSPLWFLMTQWRPGAVGGIKMGVAHGRFCIGCCWALMALMFVGGSMNLLWTAGLALFMLAEKALPAGRTLGRIAGAGLIVWGAGVLGTALLVMS